MVVVVVVGVLVGEDQPMMVEATMALSLRRMRLVLAASLRSRWR